MALFFQRKIKRGRMTIDDFKALEDQQKVQLIFDAYKITEKVDDEANYQLFQIDNLYVETKTSLEGKFKRSFKTYSLRELPVHYAGEVLGMPIVQFTKDISPTANNQAAKKKEKYL